MTETVKLNEVELSGRGLVMLTIAGVFVLSVIAVSKYGFGVINTAIKPQTKQVEAKLDGLLPD